MSDDKPKGPEKPPSASEIVAQLAGEVSRLAAVARGEMQAEEKKPEDEKAEDKKPEDKKAEDKKPEDKKPEDKAAVAVAAEKAPAGAAQPLPRIVEFKNVSKTYYPGTPKAFTAIRDVSFFVEDLPHHGEFIAILGPSGCGKSTVLKLIAGLEPQHPATTGEVLLWGKPVEGPGADRGMVFQEYTAFDNRTVAENIAFGLECRGVPRRERRERALEWVAKVGLDPKKDANKFPHQLSGGMRQRVAIARSLILQPRILLMDEPFGALDPMTRLRMQDLLISLWREVEATVFFVTHSIEEAVYLGDRIYVFSSGPGTIVREIPKARPDRPALVMQSEPEFLAIVKDLRMQIAEMEGGKD